MHKRRWRGGSGSGGHSPCTHCRQAGPRCRAETMAHAVGERIRAVAACKRPCWGKSAAEGAAGRTPGRCSRMEAFRKACCGRSGTQAAQSGRELAGPPPRPLCLLNPNVASNWLMLPPSICAIRLPFAFQRIQKTAALPHATALPFHICLLCSSFSSFYSAACMGKTISACHFLGQPARPQPASSAGRRRGC